MSELPGEMSVGSARGRLGTVKASAITANLELEAAASCHGQVEPAELKVSSISRKLVKLFLSLRFCFGRGHT